MDKLAELDGAGVSYDELAAASVDDDGGVIWAALSLEEGVYEVANVELGAGLPT